MVQFNRVAEAGDKVGPERLDKSWFGTKKKFNTTSQGLIVSKQIGMFTNDSHSVLYSSRPILNGPNQTSLNIVMLK